MPKPKNLYIRNSISNHGSRYVGKIFNDDWMRDRGFLDKESITAKDLIMPKIKEELITVEVNDTIASATKKISSLGISQLPVSKNGDIVGALTESHEH